MSNKLLKILSLILVVMLVTIFVAGTVHADFDFSPNDVELQSPNDEDVKDIKDISGKILGGIQIGGIVLSIGILMVLGIKYMMGSTSEKAEYKKTMIPYLIGAVILFTATSLANGIFNIASSFNKKEETSAIVTTVDENVNA